MLGKIFDKILHEESEYAISKHPRELADRKRKSKNNILRRENIYLLLIFLVAIATRFFILFANDTQSPGWYDDTFHHWQIAYLTKTVGFKHGFLRLWDLKGMEYFWGLLHPLVLIAIFTLTGSVDIIVVRMLSIVSGSLVIVFIFILLRRYFNFASALGAAMFAIFMPVVWYSDTVGMQEPLGLVLILGALLLWPRKGFLSGLLLALAGMVRAEYWLFGIGLVGAITLSKEKFDDKMVLFIGWLLPTLLYAKYLLDRTGNAIYPIYWNFLASVKGEWFADVALPPGALQAQLVARIIFAVGVIGALAVLVRRPRYYLLFLLGFGNVFFLGFMLGFSAYIKGYVPRFWIDRLFSWPYTFLGILLSVFLLYWIPSKVRQRTTSLVFGWLVLIAVLLSSQVSWGMIEKYASEGRSRYQGERELAEKVASFYSGGKILIPEDRPPFVYFLVSEQGIKGPDLLGQMFDPFFYFEGDTSSSWPEKKKEVLNWLKDNDVRLMVVYQDRERYQNLIKEEPEMFKILNGTESIIQIYEVKTS